MRISVLSAGNAGQAFAGGMTMSGHEIHLAAVPEHDQQIRIIQTFGGVLGEERAPQEEAVSARGLRIRGGRRA